MLVCFWALILIQTVLRMVSTHIVVQQVFVFWLLVSAGVMSGYITDSSMTLQFYGDFFVLNTLHLRNKYIREQLLYKTTVLATCGTFNMCASRWCVRKFHTLCSSVIKSKSTVCFVLFHNILLKSNIFWRVCTWQPSDVLILTSRGIFGFFWVERHIWLWY